MSERETKTGATPEEMLELLENGKMWIDSEWGWTDEFERVYRAILEKLDLPIKQAEEPE